VAVVLVAGLRVGVVVCVRSVPSLLAPPHATSTNAAGASSAMTMRVPRTRRWWHAAMIRGRRAGHLVTFEDPMLTRPAAVVAGGQRGV
jgi:hypothetical protein